MTQMTFREAEQRCQQTFLSAGQWWHLFAPGKETPIIFKNDDDYRFAINLLARCSIEHPRVHLIAFELMSNHLHLACSGASPDILRSSNYSEDVLRDISAKAKGYSLNLFCPVSNR